MSRAFRLGVFIVVALLIFAGGVFWIGKKQFLFHSTYRLKAEFQNVAGLNGGAEVRVGGVHEGTVRQIQLPIRPNEKVRVLMDLAGGTRNVIKKDSLATIRSEGLVGDKFVEISFGSEQSPKVGDGDMIQGEPPLQISDLLNKTNEVLDSTLKHNFFLRGFFKDRGYESAADLKKNEISQLPDKPLAKQFTYEAKRVFDKPDAAKLKDAKALNDAGNYLQSNPFGLAVVAAYTDMKGDTEKDRLLSEARSMVARDYLVKNFKLQDTKIKTIGLGKSDKAPDGGSIEILIYPEGTTAAQNRSTSPSP